MNATPAPVAARSPASAPLSAAQLDAFSRDGYVVVPGFLAAGEVDAVRAWTDEVQRWPEEPGRWMMYFEQSEDGGRLLNRMEDLLPWHEGFRELARGRLAAACGQLLGERAVLFKDKINFKQPGGGGFEAHQDVQAGWSRYADLHVTALVAVDRSTVANGCLEMVAGFGQRSLIGREWEPLGEEELAGCRWVAIESAPGDAVFFDSFVPHRSAPNRSPEQRRVLYYTYNRASAGDHLRRYYEDKRASYPPDIEREAGREYRFRV